jgi:hypothetical protein
VSTDLWLDVILAVLAAVFVVGGPVLAVTEHRRERREEALQPLGDWADNVHVHIPGINNLPAKRRVKGSGPERLKGGDLAWVWDDRYEACIPAHVQRTPLPASTYHPSAAPRPAAPGAALPLDGFGWPDANPTPLPATQPHRTVFTVPVRRQEVA